MSEHIPIITTASFFFLVYIASIILSTEYKIRIVSSRAIIISIAFILIVFSWILGLPLSTALSIYFVVTLSYIFLRISYFKVVVEYIKATPVSLIVFVILSLLLFKNIVLSGYDESFLAQISKSLWMGFTNSDEAKYYLLKGFLWSALNSYSDIFDYRVGTLIEWSIFLLFVCPLFKKTGNNIILVILLLLFLMPGIYYTTSYSDGSSSIFFALVFFGLLSYLNGKIGFHELIAPLFLLSISKSDSIFTVGIFMIAIFAFYLINFVKNLSNKKQIRFNKIGIFLIGCILIILFNLFLKSLYPKVAENYSNEFINSYSEEQIELDDEQELVQELDDEHFLVQELDDELFNSNLEQGLVQELDDELFNSNLEQGLVQSTTKVSLYNWWKDKSKSSINIIIEEVQFSLGKHFKASLKLFTPNLGDLYTFGIFVLLWLIYKYRHSSEDEKVSLQYFLIVYIGVFIYINLSYVFFFAKSEINITAAPSFIRYFYRTMLIPLVLLHNFYSARYDLTKFPKNIKTIAVYLLVFIIALYTQIWRFYQPIAAERHEDIRYSLQQCNVSNLNYQHNVHFIDQLASGETRVIASSYAYPVGMIGSPCIGERDSYCYPNIKTHNDWLSYLALYGTTYIVVHNINEYLINNLWPETVEIPSTPFCVRVRDWKTFTSKNN